MLLWLCGSVAIQHADHVNLVHWGAVDHQRGAGLAPKRDKAEGPVEALGSEVSLGVHQHHLSNAFNPGYLSEGLLHERLADTMTPDTWRSYHAPKVRLMALLRAWE